MILYHMQKLTAYLWGLCRIPWQSISPREDIIITGEPGVSGPWDRQQEFGTTHVTSEHIVLKSRAKPHVRKSNQRFYSGQKSTSTVCNSLKQTPIETPFSPLFSVNRKRSALVIFLQGLSEGYLNHRNVPISIAYSQTSQLFLTQIQPVLHWSEFHCLAEMLL